MALGKAVKSNLTFRKILRLGLNSSGCTDCTDRSKWYNSVNTFIQQKVELERWSGGKFGNSSCYVVQSKPIIVIGVKSGISILVG